MKIRDIMNGKWFCLKDPILKPGAGKAWDNLSVITPGIFAEGVESKYGMFYVGLSSDSDNWGIGYAESEDLFVWKKHDSNPLIHYEDEKYCYSFDSPCMIRKNGRYHLFCEEKKFKKDLKKKMKYLLSVSVRNYLKRFRRLLKDKGTGALSVKHAEERYFVSLVSTKLLDWDMESKKVVFEKGGPGRFDDTGLFSPQVHEFDGKYYMFYGGSNGNVTSTGLAVSDDLLNWQRTDFSPVLKPGGRGEWDENNALIVSVLKTEDGYCGFYEGEDGENTYRIGLAYSYDLKSWEKFEGNPIIQTGEKGSFSEKRVCSPHVFSDKGKVFLFYTGDDRNMRSCCGMAKFER